MPISDTIPPPEFVELGATKANGLDLLGLRLPVQTIGGVLLNGVTSVTRTVRYLSLRTWLLYRYVNAQPPPPDRHRSFLDYASRAEAALTLANLIRSRSTGGLIGPVRGTSKLDEEGDIIDLEQLAKQLAVVIYAGASDQLRLTRSRDPQVSEIGSERGEPLALVVEQSLGDTSIGRRLGRSDLLDLATRDELEELGRLAWIEEIPEAERRELIRALVPEELAPGDKPRVGTYAVLLALAEQTGGRLDEHDLFDEAVRPVRKTPAVLAETLDGWLLYAVRDAIAVTGEAVLSVVVDKLQELDPESTGFSDEALVRQLLADSVPQQLAALRELGLGDGAEDLGAMAFSELEERVRDATPEVASEQGLRRWPGMLTEPSLYRGVGGVRGGALVFALVSWMVSERRAGLAARQDEARARLLSHQGNSRFGLNQIVLPRLAEWRGRRLSVASALSELTHLVIDQHLRIAWVRLAQDPRKDVSVLLRDGDRLIRRVGYEGGRTASRLPQAIGWLHQLGLLADEGLTEDGHRVLGLALRSLVR